MCFDIVRKKPPYDVMNVPEDVFRLFTEDFNVLELINVCNVSRATRNYLHRLFLHGFENKLRRFVEDPRTMRKIMRAARAVVSGSFALALLDRKSSAWRNPPRDLDIYLPKGQSKFLASYFVNEEKYRIIWKGGPRTSKNSSYPEGVASIIRLRRVSPMTGRNVFIELISSKDEVAMTPVLSFHSTPVMCALSADALFSPYPRLTHELQWGFINANCLRGLQTINAAAHSAINKYEDRGYILRTNCAYMPINGDDPTIQWLFAHRCEESYYCPHTSRSTGDRGCLKLRFDLAYEEEAVFHGSDAALWRLGGTVCFEMHTAGYTSFSSGAKRFYSKIFDDELDANDD